MQAIDLSKPGEKKKLIGAAILGLVAVLVMWWALFGFGGGSASSSTPRATATPSPATTRTRPRASRPAETAAPEVASLAVFREIQYQQSSYSAPEAKRNIFAYYVPPLKPVPVVQEPTPIPTPPPPLLLASLSPSSAYARSADFKLEISGDKFTPDTRIYYDGRELPTTYKGPQQLSATVSASLIATPGSHQIIVRNADNTLYSNTAQLNVAAPPTPNYLYVGIISPNNRVDDTALVQDRSNRNILNVKRGDLLSGRFRVTSISDKELVMVDTNLKIKHSLAMTEGERNLSSPLTRPTPQVEAEDDEP